MSRKISWNICRWDGDLGHLEDDIAAVAHDFRADLDQLVLQTRQRPILDVFLYGFDLIELDGEDLRREPLEYPTETGLLGWAERTRTQKYRRKISL